MQSKPQAKKPFILILYGYPGSGKSTFAKQFADEIDNTLHINIDKVDAELGEQLKKRNMGGSYVSDLMVEYMCQEFLQNGFNIILDIPVFKKADRRRLRSMALNNKSKLVMAWLQIDAESAFERLRKRDKRKTIDKYAKNYTRSEFESLINSSQNPSEEDYVVISGKHTFNTQKLAVFKKFQQLGILSREQAINKKIKPELVNLIPPMMRPRDDLKRRDISIR